jgi:hypothetical protein
VKITLLILLASLSLSPAQASLLGPLAELRCRQGPAQYEFRILRDSKLHPLTGPKQNCSLQIVSSNTHRRGPETKKTIYYRIDQCGGKKLTGASPDTGNYLPKGFIVLVENGSKWIAEAHFLRSTPPVECQLVNPKAASIKKIK